MQARRDYTPWIVVLAGYLSTSLCILLGIIGARHLLTIQTHRFQRIESSELRKSVWRPLCSWDGVFFVEICTDGYKVDLDRRPSNVVNFPAYPISSAILAGIARIGYVPALLILSHACLIASSALLLAYAEVRTPKIDKKGAWVLVMLFCTWPTTLFLRMAYSESLYLLITVLVFYGMKKQWSVTSLALLVGFATASRVIGWVLIPVLISFIVSTTPQKKLALLKAVACLPLAAWGVIAFMIYQYVAFGDPLLFVKAAREWSLHRATYVDAIDALWLKPILFQFYPKSPYYWAMRESNANPIVSFQLWSTCFWLLAFISIIKGSSAKWLDREEAIFGLLGVLGPYMLMAPSNGMLSQGRYAMAVFPVYLVVSRVLTSWRDMTCTFILLGCAVLLGLFAALFSTWYRVF